MRHGSRSVVQVQLRHALDRYFILLVAILMTIVAIATVPPEGWGAVAIVTLQAFTALLAVSTSDSRPMTRRVVRIVVAVAFLSVTGAAVFGTEPTGHVAYSLMMLVLVAVVPFAIARRLFSHERVTLETVIGALCIYLLIGLFFVVVQSSYQREVGEFFASGPAKQPSDFVYFSYVTLATVGYGDLTPGPAMARMIAIMEALIGQLYLVTVVAVLVSNLSRGTANSLHGQSIATSLLDDAQAADEAAAARRNAD